MNTKTMRLSYVRPMVEELGCTEPLNLLVSLSVEVDFENFEESEEL